MTPLDPPYSAGLASALPMTRYLSRLIIVFTAVLLARPAVGQTATDRRNSIVAEVNDKIITRQMVTDAMSREAELLRRQYARQPQLFGQKYTQLQADTLEALIRRELVLIEYQEKGYKLPESIIEQRILEDIRTDYGNRVTLIKSLQQSDMTYEEFARYQREKIIQMVMRGQFISKVNIVISPRQIEEYYVANKDTFRSGIEIRLRIIFSMTKSTGARKIPANWLTRFTESCRRAIPLLRLLRSILIKTVPQDGYDPSGSSGESWLRHRKRPPSHLAKGR